MKHGIITLSFMLSGSLLQAALAATATSSEVPAAVRAAVDNEARPAADRARDENRNPASVLAFAGIKAGQKVAELLPSPGYYTRLICHIVGPSGKVYAVELKDKDPKRETKALDTAGCQNVVSSTEVATKLQLAPGNLDVVWTTENYHDLKDDYWEGGIPDTKAFNAAVFKALKPGGVYIVEDHAAEVGSGDRDVNTLHRIDPALVKQEVTSAGFVLLGESDAVHHPEDPHTAKVFTLKGKSDRFLLKFQKPAK